jgi:hypothetical protein
LTPSSLPPLPRFCHLVVEPRSSQRGLLPPPKLQVLGASTQSPSLRRSSAASGGADVHLRIGRATCKHAAPPQRNAPLTLENADLASNAHRRGASTTTPRARTLRPPGKSADPDPTGPARGTQAHRRRIQRAQPRLEETGKMPPGLGADRAHSRIRHPKRTPLLEEADPSPRTHITICEQAATILRDAPPVTRAQTPTPPNPQEARKRAADVTGEHDPVPRALAKSLQTSAPTVQAPPNPPPKTHPSSRGRWSEPPNSHHGLRTGHGVPPGRTPDAGRADLGLTELARSTRTHPSRFRRAQPDWRRQTSCPQILGPTVQAPPAPPPGTHSPSRGSWPEPPNSRVSLQADLDAPSGRTLRAGRADQATEAPRSDASATPPHLGLRSPPQAKQ